MYNIISCSSVTLNWHAKAENYQSSGKKFEMSCLSEIVCYINDMNNILPLFLFSCLPSSCFSFTVKTGDFFDSGMMDILRQDMIKLTKKTQIDVNSGSNSVTFQSTVSIEMCFPPQVPHKNQSVKVQR